MQNWLVEHQAALRLAAFLGVLLLLLVAEALWPRRAGPMRRGLRWPSNFGVATIYTLITRVVLRAGAVGAAAWAATEHIGVLNRAELSGPLAFLLAFFALDALIYWQHRWMHRSPVLWRLHRVHHSDVELDASTALRFHPFEIMFSSLIKISGVVALGAPVSAVIMFEVALNAGAMFNHSNLRLPVALDRALRCVLVTPDMHRVHHSVHAREYNTNFGFTVPWWDWLFRSYTAQPADGHTAMRIGLAQFREEQDQRLSSLLRQPRSHPRESGGPAS